MDPQSRIEILEKKIKRLKKSQNEAENLLEQKSREIYEINERLEQEVVKRTKEFEIARDDAIRANLAKSQFLANMSHEIRTPLNGMLGFVGLLLKSKMTDSQMRQLKVVHESGHFLLSIINDILEFSKIEAGKVEVEIKPINISKTVESIVDIVANQIFDKGLECPVFIDESLPHSLLSDEAKIRQVMINLVGNAVKFTPSGEVSIRVINSGLDQHGNTKVTFEIQDTGIGIPASSVDKIFKPFEQADVSDTRKYGGTGLGLSISRQFVESMGGQIGVRSEESKGSCFHFTIPMEIAEKTNPVTNQPTRKVGVAVLTANTTIQNNLIERIQSWGCTNKIIKNTLSIDWSFSESEEKVLIVDFKKIEDLDKLVSEFELNATKSRLLILAHPSELKKTEHLSNRDFVRVLQKPIKRLDIFNGVFEIKETKSNSVKPIKLVKKGSKLASEVKILLVEDNLINQQVAIAMLSVHGFSADIANNGEEAVEMHSNDDYDIILMDCQMPVMDGFDATRKIREKNSEVPIVAMTANAFRKTKEECFDAGMSEFVTKPISDEHLAEVIKKHVFLKAS